VRVFHTFSGLRDRTPDRAFLLPQLKLLERRGHEVAVVVPAGRAWGRMAASEGLKVYSWSTLGKVDPVNLICLVSLFRKERPDIVDTHHTTSGMYSAWAGRLTGTPVVSTVHATNNLFCFRWSTALIAVSDGVKDHLVKQGYPAERIYTVRNGVDTDWFAFSRQSGSLRQKLGLQEDARLIAVIGRLTERKGHELLVQAMPSLAERGLDAHVVIAGEGQLAARLRARADQLGVGERLHLLGQIQDVRPLLWAADLYAMPSLHGEGLSKALLQAMACGAPIVATDIAGVTEALTSGENALLVEPGRPEPLAEALARLLERPEEAKALAASARERVVAEFSSARVASELEAVYTELLARRAGRQPR